MEIDYHLLDCYAGRQVAEHVVHRDVQPANARLPAALIWFDGEDGLVGVHTTYECRACAIFGSDTGIASPQFALLLPRKSADAHR